LFIINIFHHPNNHHNKYLLVLFKNNLTEYVSFRLSFIVILIYHRNHVRFDLIFFQSYYFFFVLQGPIIVEQWLPYKPAPKRIIKHSLPREALQTPPPPHNIIFSYSKPRALIEVELVRLPVVKIDPQTYEQMSANGQQQLIQHPTFQHEQEYLSGNRSTQSTNEANQINWRI
jgi:hypothetical protein